MTSAEAPFPQLGPLGLAVYLYDRTWMLASLSLCIMFVNTIIEVRRSLCSHPQHDLSLIHI